jgi:hypothetical protein
MIKIKKINKEKINPIPVPKLDPDKVKGSSLFTEVYANIFLCARKKSGKTNAIFKILKSCSDKDTNIVIFSTTVHKDINMKHIVKYFRNKGNEVQTYMSIKEGKEDQLQTIIDELKNDYSDEESSDGEKEEETKYINVSDDDDSSIKVKKKKKIAPEWIFVLDDMGVLLKNPSVAQLLKTNRHFKSKVILSSQYPHDMTPEARRQLDYMLLWGGHSREKLEILFEDADLPISYQLFENLYKDATKDKYNFLYVDVRNVKFRKNFNQLYDISNI